MKKEQQEEYELIAKHCPECQSLVMARLIKEADGRLRYAGYCCSTCSWKSPVNDQQKRAG